ncbi:MAG: HDOD domain-containing protein [Rugosibacter sp.]|nr:HDOD domain-containing protein [Rugosibacter sp.]
MIEQFELNQLPALPQVLTRLIRELNNENAQLRDISDLMGQDPALTVKILSVANSSYYGRRESISSVEQSISLLGVKVVKLIAVSAAMQQFMNSFSGKDLPDFPEFWRHSLLTGLMARLLAQSVNYPDPEEAYLAGLLHDVGKLALLAVKTDSYRDILAHYDDTEHLLKHELLAFGITHCEVGALLIERWRMEPLVADAIRHHHDAASQANTATELSKIVLLANALSRNDLSETSNHPAIALARGLFGLSTEEVRRMSADSYADMVALMAPLGLEQATAMPERGRHGLAVPADRDLQAELHGSTMISLAQEVFDGNHESGEESLLESVLQAADILFEPRKSFLFEWDEETNMVSGHPILGQRHSIQRIRFPLEPGKSLIADALLDNTITQSSNKDIGTMASLIDEQLARLGGSHGIICLPLATRRFMYGSLVLTLSESRLQRLTEQSDLLLSFSRQAAHSISLVRQKAKAAAQTSLATATDYQSHARQVIHEASNPLSVLKNYLKVLDLKLADSQSVAHELQILNEEIDRVTNIIGKLARPEEQLAPTLAPVSINDLIRNVLTICSSGLFREAGIHVETNLNDELPPIRSDAAGLKQVLVNLLKNAAEAMPEGGALKITSAETINQDKVSAVSITISDTGPGIPRELLARIFSPVETSKKAPHSGLGLSISAGILQNLGGSIRCKSVPGLGATFEILLPVERTDALATAPASRSDHMRKLQQ